MTADILPAGLIPFPGLHAGAITALVLIYLATASIRGAFGFGAVAPAIVFSSMVIDPHRAVLLALVAGALSQVQVIPFGLRHGNRSVAKPMLVAGCAAILIGVLVFKHLKPGWLTVCLGVAMGGIVLMDRYHVLDRLSQRVDLRNLPTALGLSTASGLLAGVAGGGGMYLFSVYIKLTCPEPTLMRGTSILLSSILIYWRFFVAVALGLISPRLFIEGLLLMPPSLIGVWAGIRFFKRADSRRFYGAFQIVLLSGSLILLWKGFHQVL